MNGKRLVFGLILVALASINRPQISQGQQKDRSPHDLMAIDTHVHVEIANPMVAIADPEVTYTGIAAKVASTCRGPEEKTVQLLAKEMEEANIGMVLLMGGVGIEGDPLGIKRSLRIAKALAALPKPKQAKIIAAVDPSKGLSEAQMETVREQLHKHRDAIVAFKCYLGYLGAPTDPGYDPFYKLALEQGLPVIFHTGDSWGPKTRVLDAKPLLVDDIAGKYPELHIVLAHMGVPWHVDAAVMLWRHENVWVDLSGLYVGPSKPLDEMIASGQLRSIPGTTHMSDLIEALTWVDRYDRVLYGTDWALAEMPSYRRFIEAVVPEEHHVKVFRTNAEELFGVKVNQ